MTEECANPTAIHFESHPEIPPCALRGDHTDPANQRRALLVKKKHTKKQSFKDNSKLVNWYFEPSQLQRIISGLKQASICLLLTLHTSHRITNSLKTTKSVPTQIHIKHTQTSNTKFSENYSLQHCPCLKSTHG